MRLVVANKFTDINLLVLALTLVTLSWLFVSQLTFISVAISTFTSFTTVTLYQTLQLSLAARLDSGM